jgi:hypothetical protein
LAKFIVLKFPQLKSIFPSLNHFYSRCNLRNLLIVSPFSPSRSAARKRNSLPLLIVASLVAFSLSWLTTASGQNLVESYTATVIPAEGYSGGSGRVTVQITSYTSDAERAKLTEALKKSTPGDAVALLRSMSHGHINIEGQSGRDIAAVFSRKSDEGRRLTLILEHVLTLYEQNQGIKASDFPFTIVRIKFDPLGQPLSGEIIPAAKIKVTKDGLFDVETESRNSGTIIDIKRVN